MIVKWFRTISQSIFYRRNNIKMNGKCLTFHLFKRVEKKSRLGQLRNLCSPASLFSSSSSSYLIKNSSTTTGGSIASSLSSSISSNTSVSSTDELFSSVPPRWTVEEFDDVPKFIHDYIDNTGKLEEDSKTVLMIKQCHSVVVVEDVNLGYSRSVDSDHPFHSDRLVVSAIILSNENEAATYGINIISMNEEFIIPRKKVLVDALLFNEVVKHSKRRVLAMIIIHHLVQLCKLNEISHVNASSNDDNFQYFLDSGFRIGGTDGTNETR